MSLTQTITTLYNAILGRAPTQAEIDSAEAAIQGGILNLTQLQQQISSGPEAITKIEQLLTQAMGSVGSSAMTALVAYWTQQLGSGSLTLQQIEKLLTGSTT